MLRFNIPLLLACVAGASSLARTAIDRTPDKNCPGPGKRCVILASALFLTGLGLWWMQLPAIALSVSVVAVLLTLRLRIQDGGPQVWFRAWLNAGALVCAGLMVVSGWASWTYVAAASQYETVATQLGRVVETVLLAVYLSSAWRDSVTPSPAGKQPQVPWMLCLLMALMVTGIASVALDDVYLSAELMLWPNLVAVQAMLWAPVPVDTKPLHRGHVGTSGPLPLQQPQSEENGFKRLFHRVPVASAYLRYGQVVMVNAEFRRLLNLRADDPVSNDLLWASAYPEEAERNLVRHRLHVWQDQARTHGGRAGGLEMNMRDANGQRRSFLVSGSWFGPSALLSFSDVTEARQLQSQLTVQEDRLMVALAALDDGVWDWNLETGEVKVNDLYALILGYDSARELSPHIGAFMYLVHPDDHAAVESYRNAVMNSTRVHHLELRLLTKSGKYIWVLSRCRVVRRNAEGEAIRLVGTTRDISHRKAVEMELRHAFNEQLAVFETAPVGICIVSNGRILQFNRRVRELFQGAGTKRSLLEQVDGFLTSCGVYSDTGHAAHPTETRFAGHAIEHCLAHPDGKERWLRIYARAVEMMAPSDGLVVIMEDVTEERRLLLEWERAKDQALSAQRLTTSLMANFRHEMNTPFNAILGFSELIMEHDPDPGVRVWAEHIHGSGKDLQHKLRLLGEVAELNAGTVQIRRQRFDLSGMLNEVLKAHADRAIGKGLGLDLDGVPPGVQLLADRSLMMRAIDPVIDNAVRYTRAGGVQLRAAIEGSSANKSRLVVQVTDSGMGFEASDIQQSFLPLTRGPMATAEWSSGMGMGLSVARSIAHLLRGSVTVAHPPASE